MTPLALVANFAICISSIFDHQSCPPGCHLHCQIALDCPIALLPYCHCLIALLLYCPIALLPYCPIALLPLSELPKDEDELMVHMQLSYKQSIEIAEEQALNTIFNNNHYELTKKRLYYDLATIGIACVKNTYNKAEGIKVEYVDPANIVYSYSDSPYFEDIYYVGEIKNIPLKRIIKELKNGNPVLIFPEGQRSTDGEILPGEAGKRNISEYNDMMKKSKKDLMPYIVLMIDELADLMMYSPRDTSGM